MPTDQDELARMKVAENEHNKAVKEKKTEDVKNWRTWTKDANLVEAAWVGGEDGIEFFEELLNSAYVWYISHSDAWGKADGFTS